MRRRSSSTSASGTSGTRGICPTPSTSRGARSSRASSEQRPIVTSRSSSTARPAARSAFADEDARRSSATTNVRILAGGFVEWKRSGLPTVVSDDARPRAASALQPPPPDPRGRRGGPAQAARLARSSCIGAGGLGSPAALYLAAAGIGTLGIVDDDVVDASNLQRQILHATDRIGRPRSSRAKRTIEALNPDVNVSTYRGAADVRERRPHLRRGYDVIVDGADNFPTRYLVNDASRLARHPGRARLDLPLRGPGHRVRAGRRARATAASSRSRRRPSSRRRCAEAGVLGVLPGIIGSLQAIEALKLALGIGDAADRPAAAVRRARARRSPRSTLRRDPECPVCGDAPTITEYIDYVEFCAGPGAHA